jgi:hypothetical protein
MSNKLINYENPDIEFIVTDSLSDELYLEEGTDFIVILDENSEDEIMEWAENQELIDDYRNDDGSLDLESLKTLKEEADLVEYNENPPHFATPSGRAFEWFENLKIILPNGVHLVEGPHPGSDWCGVSITNIDHLLPLQKFLFTEGYKVNFHLNFEYDEDQS